MVPQQAEKTFELFIIWTKRVVPYSLIYCVLLYLLATVVLKQDQMQQEVDTMENNITANLKVDK